jgi:ClpP class serine protease
VIISDFGQEAKALGLIDELGGGEKAFEIAAKGADIKAYRVLDYTKKVKKPRKGLLLAYWSRSRLVSISMGTAA